VVDFASYREEFARLPLRTPPRARDSTCHPKSGMLLQRVWSVRKSRFCLVDHSILVVLTSCQQ
jgi:hypothetical protein